jgi:hypothetical protein
MMKTLSLHMQTNNGVSTNMGIVYVAPVQNKAGIQNDTFHGEFIRISSTWNMFAAPLITGIRMEP